MVHILLRPTLSITVTETVVKAQGSLWWETNRWKSIMESPVSNHPPFSAFYFDKSAYCCYPAIGTTTGTLFSYDNRTHPIPNGREDVWCQKLVATMNVFTMVAVSIMRMHTGSYGHLIALITFSICNFKPKLTSMCRHVLYKSIRTSIRELS